MAKYLRLHDCKLVPKSGRGTGLQNLAAVIGLWVVFFALDAKPQSVTSWGPPADGVQMSIALTNPVVAAGSTIWLQCLVINPHNGLPTIPTNVFDEAYTTNPFRRSHQGPLRTSNVIYTNGMRAATLADIVGFTNLEQITNLIFCGNEPMTMITNGYGEVYSTSGMVMYAGIPDWDMQVILTNAAGAVYDLSCFPSGSFRPGFGGDEGIYLGTLEKYKIPVNFPKDLTPGHYRLRSYMKLTFYSGDAKHLVGRFPKVFSNALDIEVDSAK